MIRRQSGEDLSPRIRDIPLEVNWCWLACACCWSPKHDFGQPFLDDINEQQPVSFSSMTMK